MKKNIPTLAVTFFAALSSLASCNSGYKPDISTTASPKGTNVFLPDSTSIAANYKIPKWFEDAKFGIFIHWGVYSVPSFTSEWYARWMYKEGSPTYKFHVENYGPLTEFGYKDFIPMFKGEKFNPDEWAELFKLSGAKYVVPVAEHHDGFAMYKSTFNKWNSVDMGPKRDVIGELKKAITAQGLHFGLSSHRCENAWFYEYGMDTPSDVQNMSISLYGERLHEPEGKGMTPYCGKYEGSNEKSRREFLLHTYELIDQYQPELIWFDWTVGKYPFQPTFYKFMAYYYNNALDWGKEVVVNTKFGYGDNIQVFDIERGKSDRIRKHSWQTDTSIGKISWCYNPKEENKTPDHIIDDFVDIVSKNGNLLLNVGPKPDGTITDEQKNVLIEIGKWLKVNGEAIYSSRPWVTPGEGENKGTAGYMTDNEKTEYTAQDIRFTTRDNNVYAISLAWDKEILIKSFAEKYLKNVTVECVEMLGSKEKLQYELKSEGLKVKFPNIMPTQYAHVLKIKLNGVVFSKPIIDKYEDKIISTVRVMQHGVNPVSLDVKSSVDNNIINEKLNVAPQTLMEKEFIHKIKNTDAPYSFNVE
ncbi:alpha-L-fucosidase [Bacteroides xylanisolvens]|uniref:alpha-L-fucosidase n=1 Tax=Bacteroides xylanisolvens TaxID=371601 RepID=UPI003511E443